MNSRKFTECIYIINTKVEIVIADEALSARSTKLIFDQVILKLPVNLSCCQYFMCNSYIYTVGLLLVFAPTRAIEFKGENHLSLRRKCFEFS